MHTTDYIVLLLYVLGIFAVGVGLSVKVKNTQDMFAAGGRSPWWASGLSGFMTMFSAGTFVVWGGIAYRLGFVAVVINLMYGIAALLVGFFVAGRWKQIGVKTPAEFVEQRFGKASLHFYTWTMMAYRLVGVAVALYALAVLMVAMMPLAESNPLRDATTGNMSLTWAIVLFGGCVVVYTIVGGLWAVLMTDVLQFIVLNLAVLFILPLILIDVGGIGGFVKQAPEGFFMPVAGEFTWFFMAGWCAIHFFMIGAEWAFAQRYICVPTKSDARKGAWLFGVLYLISPVLWLMPPLVWRVIQPIPADATPEQITALAERAYIDACAHVLPVGMLGLMLAAMFSATASMVSSQLNVFAGVLTEDIYAKWRRPGVSIGAASPTDDRELLWAGRGFSLLLGAGLVVLAIAIPYLGGAEKVVIAITSLMVGPLLAPSVWGLLNKSVRQSAVWMTAGTCFLAGLLGEYVFKEQLSSFGRTPTIIIGVVLPVIVLIVVSILSRGESAGWKRLTALSQSVATSQDTANIERSDQSPAYIVAGTLMACALLMGVLALMNDTDQLVIGVFALSLFALSAGIALMAHRRSGKFRPNTSEVL
jgi:Na+/proline symporter